MRNWAVDTTQLKKDRKQYAAWRLEQLINFGLDGEKISEAELRERWDDLRLDPDKKRFLHFLLWGEQSSPPSR